MCYKFTFDYVLMSVQYLNVTTLPKFCGIVPKILLITQSVIFSYNYN